MTWLDFETLRALQLHAERRWPVLSTYLHGTFYQRQLDLPILFSTISRAGNEHWRAISFFLAFCFYISINAKPTACTYATYRSNMRTFGVIHMHEELVSACVRACVAFIAQCSQWLHVCCHGADASEALHFVVHDSCVSLSGHCRRGVARLGVRPHGVALITKACDVEVDKCNVRLIMAVFCHENEARLVAVSYGCSHYPLKQPV